MRARRASPGGGRAWRIRRLTTTRGIIYLSLEVPLNFLLNLPKAENIAAKVNAAMRDIEKHNPQLARVLPKADNLLNGILKKVSEIPAAADCDSFRRTYEYLLAELGISEGQGSREFHTSRSISRFLTEVIGPFYQRILNQEGSSDDMFVSSARIVAERKKKTAAELAVHELENTDETRRPCNLDLIVDGLEGDNLKKD